MTVVRLRAIQRRRWVVEGHPILGHQDRGGRLGLLEEQGIVTDAETEKNVQVGLVMVEKLGLRHGVANRLELLGISTVDLGHADILLGDRPALAQDGNDFKALCLEDLAEDSRLRDKAPAGRDSNLLGAEALGELDGVFHPGPLVLQGMRGDMGGGERNLVDRRILVVEVQRALQDLLLSPCWAERWRFVEIVGLAALNAAVATLQFGGFGRRFSSACHCALSLR